MKSIALAAGLGTRLRPYTDRFAKPLLPIFNTPLLWWATDLLKQAGASQLVVNACYKQDQIKELAARTPGFASVKISVEAPFPLGAGGGVWNARRWLEGDGSFLVANGDEVIWPSSPLIFKNLRDTHTGLDALATIYVMRHPLVGTKFGGVWTDRAGRVHGFGRTRPSGADASVDLEPFHYVGLQIVSDRVFQYLPEGESNLLYDALAKGIAEGERVLAVVDHCDWFETGNPADFLAASAACLRSYASRSPSASLERIASATWPSYSKRAGDRCLGISARGPWSVELGRLRANGGAAVVGDRCTLGEGAQLSGACAIGDDVVLGTSCMVENSVVMAGAQIEPGARIANEIVMPVR